MKINGGCSLAVAGILISLDLPRQGDRGEQRWRLWEHRERGNKTGNKRERIREKEREGGEGRTPTGYAHCARSKYAAPNKTSSHETMGGYGWDATNTHASMRTHTYQITPSHLIL